MFLKRNCCLINRAQERDAVAIRKLGGGREHKKPHCPSLLPPPNRYVIGTLELLVAENYMIVYLNGATTRRKMPSLGWLRKCYQQIDRR